MVTHAHRQIQLPHRYQHRRITLQTHTLPSPNHLPRSTTHSPHSCTPIIASQTRSSRRIESARSTASSHIHACSIAIQILATSTSQFVDALPIAELILPLALYAQPKTINHSAVSRSLHAEPLDTDLISSASGVIVAQIAHSIIVFVPLLRTLFAFAVEQVVDLAVDIHTWAVSEEGLTRTTCERAHHLNAPSIHNFLAMSASQTFSRYFIVESVLVAGRRHINTSESKSGRYFANRTNDFSAYTIADII